MFLFIKRRSHAHCTLHSRYLLFFLQIQDLKIATQFRKANQVQTILFDCTAPGFVSRFCTITKFAKCVHLFTEFSFIEPIILITCSKTVFFAHLYIFVLDFSHHPLYSSLSSFLRCKISLEVYAAMNKTLYMYTFCHCIYSLVLSFLYSFKSCKIRLIIFCIRNTSVQRPLFIFRNEI